MTSSRWDEMYRNMRSHKDVAGLMDLLDLADGSDDFSRALALVRDCFSPETTTRALSRRKLSGILKRRAVLAFAFQAEVIRAAQDHSGRKIRDFGEALAALPSERASELRDGYEKQVELLRHGDGT